MKITDLIGSIDRDDISIHIPDNEIADKEFENGVLLISHELSATGAPLQLYELALALLDMGYQPFVYSLFDGELTYDYSNIGIVTICGSGPAFDKEWIRKLAGFFDMVFVNTLLLVQIIRILAPTSKRLFWWIHENSYLFDQRNCRMIPTVPSLTILAASGKARDHIRRYMDFEPPVMNVYTRDMGGAESEREAKAVFLWAGSIDFNKAPQVLLEAILNLDPSTMEKSEFYIFGKKTGENEYVKLIEGFAEKFPNVHFMDAVSHDELMQVIDLADAVVVSSIEETTSMIAVESFMKGKTLICSDGCGAVQDAEDGTECLIFHTKDAAALAGKLKWVVYNREEAYKIGRVGRRVYERNYSQEIFERNIEKILRDTSVINGNMNLCSGCGACVLSCPVHALTMKESDRGFLYPEVDAVTCIGCGKCRKVCPINEPDGIYVRETELQVYAFKLNDRKKRMQSQSGGAFTALAEAVLKNQGIVYGVTLSETFEAAYSEIDDIEELDKLKGSKYVQAKTGDIFEKVKARLEEGKEVLFAGTSCHVAGLLRYLNGSDTTKLYTCDLVCHGVPSPAIFRGYIDHKSAGCGDITDYKFRDKDVMGWHAHIESWKNQNDIKTVSSEYTDIFYTHDAFRECCYLCRYASFDKPADITIGDFWGIENVFPELDDNTGISLVITRSGKGEGLLKAAGTDAHVIKVSKDDCIQPNLIAPTVRPDAADAFWDDFKNKPYKYLLQSYAGSRINRKFNPEIANYIEDDEAIERAKDYIERHGMIISGICGDIKFIRRFLTRIRDKVKNTPVIINVFDEKREILNTEVVSIEDYVLKHAGGKVVIMDEMHCGSYITELVDRGISVTDILPVSFMLDEEV